jgi:hypothetical protein
MGASLEQVVKEGHLMTRTTISVLAALLLGGASVAWAGGAGKSSADKAPDPARTEAGAAGSGMSAGDSKTSGSSTMSSPSTSSGAAASSSGATAGASSQFSEADAKEKLQDQGYTQVSGLKKVGDKFEAKAMKNGKATEVQIDPATGMVTEKAG